MYFALYFKSKFRRHNLSYIVTRCLFVCLYACLRPISSETAGPIWLNFFLLAPSWSQDGFRPKKFRIQNFVGLKPSCDQDGANKKKFSKIGQAVPEEIGHKHTNTQTRTQTSCCFIREIIGKKKYRIYCQEMKFSSTRKI